MNDPVLASAFWSLGLLLAWLWLRRRRLSLNLTAASAGALLVSATLLARLVPAVILRHTGNFDLDSYRVVADLVLKGQDVYTAPAALDRYPYLPLQMYWMAGAAWASQATGWPFGLLVKLAPIGADVGLALLIRALALARGDTAAGALQAGLSYALHPVAIFVSAYHGQFDAIPLGLTFVAIRYMPAAPAWAGAWLGLAVLDKSWPVLFVPNFLATLRGFRRQVVLLAALAAVPIIGIGVYLGLHGTPALTLIGRAIGYNHGVGIWGYTYFANLLALLAPGQTGPLNWLITYGRYLTLLGLAVVWLRVGRRQDPTAGGLTMMVAFLALSHAFAVQYLVWVIPFAVLEGAGPWLTRFTLAAYAYMLLAYSTLILGMHITQLVPWPLADYALIMPAGLPAWLVCCGWLAERLRLPARTTNAKSAPTGWAEALDGQLVNPAT